MAGTLFEMVAKYLVVLLAITLLVWGNYNVSATEFVVGDAAGWNVPDSPTTYSSWASEHNFSIGDILGNNICQYIMHLVFFFNIHIDKSLLNKFNLLLK